MSSSYAVRNAQGRIVFVSEGFDMHGITQTLPLSQGAELLIAGESDELLELSLQLRQAQEANLAKEAFLSSMSHDIRTPMNAIVGMTVLARKYIDEKPRVIDALSKIETASGHLLELINDVLDMSRINSGRMQLTKEPFFLNDLVHDTLLLVRPQLEKKKHRMETDFLVILTTSRSKGGTVYGL